eukprot:6562361-Prymnesium_polylepis.1
MWLPTGRTFAWGRVGVGQRAGTGHGTVFCVVRVVSMYNFLIWVVFLVLSASKLGSSMELEARLRRFESVS